MVRERFHGQVTQRLHNYLASAQSLVEHVRRLMRDRKGPIVKAFKERKSKVLENGEMPFMHDLRNYTMHRTLPFFAHMLSMTNVNTPEQKMVSEVQLSVPQLLEWDGWRASAKTFIEAQGDAVAVRPVVRKHGELVFGLNMWLHNQLAKANDAALDEVNELIVDANTILTQGDRETARRRARRDFS
jgi:extradiol dioxygenase family protein